MRASRHIGSFVRLWELIFATVVFSATSSSQVWVERFSWPSRPLHSISYCDSLHGYAVGDLGAILRTDDGGATWTSQSSPNGNADILRKVISTSPSSAFIIANSINNRSYILFTSDSGATWDSSLTYFNGYRSGISFINSMYGVALGDDYFYRTTDGALTWQALPTPYSYLTDITFSDPGHGMVCGVLGTVFATSDSGNTWVQLNMVSLTTFTRVRMLDSLHAIVAGQGRVLRTSDGGLSWLQFLPDGEDFVDISYKDVNRIALLTQSRLVWTSDGGVAWNTSYGSYHRSISSIGTERFGVALSSGKIVQSLGIDFVPPAVELSRPANGEQDLPLMDYSASSTTVQLAWRRGEFRELAGFTYDIETRTDSVQWSGGYNLRRTFPTASETTVTLGFGDDEKYYWRMRHYFPNVPEGSMPWSPIWNFTTPPLRTLTVRQMQESPLSELLKLDTVQFIDYDYGRSLRQQSPFTQRWARSTVRCVAAPSAFSPTIAMMFVRDTAATDSGWHGILVKPTPGGPPLPNFNQVETGDLLTIIGYLSEDLCPTPTANSMTVFYCENLSILGHGDSSLSALPVELSSIYRGSHPNDTAMYSTAEQYEGVYIELHNLSVTSARDDGSFLATDNFGNTILTMDASTWFTMRGHRHAQSTFATPVVNSRIDTLRGILWTAGNSDVPEHDWGFRLAPISPGDLVYAPTQNARIAGRVFDDDNRNGVQDPGELSQQGWWINLGGQGNSKTLSNIDGEFSFAGLDSGSYSASAADDQHLPWQVNLPPGRSYGITLAQNDSFPHADFGVYFPWNWIEGKVFEDVNENGVQEPGEQPMPHWSVQLQGPTQATTWTDSLGRYSFHHALEGENAVTVGVEPSWEVIPPMAQAGQRFTFFYQGEQKLNLNFSVHRIPVRVRLRLTVYDSSPFFHQDLWWGIRPGAADGIGGADGHATNFDISEGESEIPPRWFAELMGLFDARFVDPGNAGGYFGFGSWTDLRAFNFPAQSNTYRIAVLPGYSSGGGYPMALTWSKDSVGANYAGAVTITDPYGMSADMKQVESFVVTNPGIEYLNITAARPNIALKYAVQWHLLSVPVWPAAASIRQLFPSASSNAFLYTPGATYTRQDSMTPGYGYWLKFSRGLDTFPQPGIPRLADTLHLADGWNLIGTLSVPVDVRSIVSVPPALTGNFYAFDGHYLVADSLKPEYGYWVKAKQAGDLILSAGAPSPSTKPAISVPDFETENTLIITDASGNERRLYFGIASDDGAGSEELPPVPPEGIFDARFTSNREFEDVKENAVTEPRLRFSSAEYPLTIAWEIKSPAVTPSLVIDRKTIPLRRSGSTTLERMAGRVALHLVGTPPIPKEFLLMQNYPNPFNPTTSIRYELPHDASVKIEIFDLLGRKVRVLVDKNEEAGYKETRWDGKNEVNLVMSSGVYFYRLEAVSITHSNERFQSVRKMLLVR